MRGRSCADQPNDVRVGPVLGSPAQAGDALGKRLLRLGVARPLEKRRKVGLQVDVWPAGAGIVRGTSKRGR